MQVVIIVPSSWCYAKKQAVKAPVGAFTFQVLSLPFRFGCVSNLLGALQRALILLNSLLARTSSPGDFFLKFLCSSYIAWGLPPWINQVRTWWSSWKMAEWSAVFGLSQHHQNYLRLPAAWGLWPVSLLKWCALVKYIAFGWCRLSQADVLWILKLAW